MTLSGPEKDMPKRNEYDDDDCDLDAFERQVNTEKRVGRLAVVVPAGLKQFKSKRTDGASHTLDFVPFRVTESHLRLVPELRRTEPGKLLVTSSYFCHRQVGVNQDKIVCPARTFGRKCPVCEARARFKESPHKEDEEKAKACNSSERQLWLVWDSDDRDAGVQLWDEAEFNFGANLSSYLKGTPENVRRDYLGFWKPQSGYTIRISCKEKPIGKQKNYEWSVHSFYKRDRPLPDEILDHGYDLDSMVPLVDYKTLKAIYEGTPEEDGDDRGSSRDKDRETQPSRNGHDDRREESGKKSSRFSDWDSPKRGPYEADPPETRGRDDRRSEEKPKREETKDRDRDDRPRITCATGDKVSFHYKDDRLTGEVQRINEDKMLAYIEVAGFDRIFTIGMEDLKVEKRDDTFDRKPEKAKKPADDEDRPKKKDEEEPKKTDKPAARRSKWDDDGDDGRSAAPAGKAKDDEAPAKKRKRSDD
jgi:hypothetical protein